MSASARAVNSSAATQVLGAIPIAGRYPRMIKAGKAEIAIASANPAMPPSAPKKNEARLLV